MKMKVFIEMSEFMQRGLTKMGQKKAADSAKPLEISSAQGTIQIHMKDTLLILAHKDITAKCVVIQTSTDLVMQSRNSKSFKLGASESKEFSSMVVEVKNACAFFCDINEIVEYTVKEANKRDLLQPMTCSVVMRSWLKNCPEIGLHNENSQETKISSVDLKVAMDDLYILQNITSILLADLSSLGAVWSPSES